MPSGDAAGLRLRISDRLITLISVVAAGLLLLGAGFYFGYSQRNRPPSAPAGVTGRPASNLQPVFQPAPVATTPPALPARPVSDPASTGIVAYNLPGPGAALYQLQFKGELSNAGWLAFAGRWSFQDGALAQHNKIQDDQGISYQRQVFESFLLRVSLQHLEHMGGGVYFNMPHPDKKNGAHLVRYSDDEPVLFWGYFNDDGVFQGQGHSFVPWPEKETHQIEVISAGESYAIRLDGQLVAQDIPLMSRQGHIGLSASASKVTFKSVEVFETAGSGPGPVESVRANLLSQATIVSGNWHTEGTAIHQTNDAPADFTIVSNVQARRYSLDVQVKLPATPANDQAGGGVIFHLPGPNQSGLQGAHLVRFGNQGNEIFWGYFNSNGLFVGQGSSTLSAQPDSPQALRLIVNENTYTVLVNAQPVATEIPLLRNQGWLGLLSFSGPVIFSDFYLNLSTEN